MIEEDLTAPEGDVCLFQSGNDLVVRRILVQAGMEQAEGHSPVESSGIEILVAEFVCKKSGDGAFAGSRRPSMAITLFMRSTPG